MTKGSETKIVASSIPGKGEDDLDSESLRQRRQPAAPAEEQDEHETGDHGRNGEGQVHEAVEQPLAGKFVAHEHAGRAHAENRVDRRRGDG